MRQVFTQGLYRWILASKKTKTEKASIHSRGADETFHKPPESKHRSWFYQHSKHTYHEATCMAVLVYIHLYVYVYVQLLANRDANMHRLHPRVPFNAFTESFISLLLLFSFPSRTNGQPSSESCPVVFTLWPSQPTALPRCTSLIEPNYFSPDFFMSCDAELFKVPKTRNKAIKNGFIHPVNEDFAAAGDFTGFFLHVTPRHNYYFIKVLSITRK